MKKADCKRFYVQLQLFAHLLDKKCKDRFRMWLAVFMLACVVLFSSAVPSGVVEAEGGTWVMDGAGLLTDEEEETLNAVCEQICEEHGISAPIITTGNFGGGDIKDLSLIHI